MENYDNIDDDLKHIAPNLFKIKKENAFSVPENYFETLPSLIQERCVQSKKQFSWRQLLLRPAYSVSFLICLLAGFITISYYVGQNQKTAESKLFASADSLAIEDFEESEIIESIAYDVNEKTSNNQEVEDYLIEQNIEVTQIINEL